MKPQRVQQSRLKGERLPPNTVSVTRGFNRPFGNPFKVQQLRDLNYQGDDRALAMACVAAFRRWLQSEMSFDWMGPESARTRARLLEHLPKLRGKNLACFCKPGEPCHADVLLEMANQ